ncbi:hypothetical protein BHECKSOX2_735 [Bathymodiolus heckerae thiotrophic gill symbiont]|uniref:hypothetical protein n=1 Tax=Bathymodiolus heckerae thiotrophic gill symbiont TaxID=1052212 RepID=UPI0010AF8FE1|nr:hypothetical protein [Bathymodiolus heckerae thiotrophic gill symbiont]SMN13612.1 hypothetical protein BHECKSOX2_735 [Bathymodiolus heckerae thiotrophic gill symbiont]
MNFANHPYLCKGLTVFFNQQEKRSGSLFQGKFKAKHLDGDFALPTVSAYVNLNHKHHKIDPQKIQCV